MAIHRWFKIGRPRDEGVDSGSGRRSLNLTELSILAIFAGAIIGGSAVLFRALVAAIHNFFFFGTLDFYYDPNRHTGASPFGPLIILSPVIGGIAVVFLTRMLPPERRGQ